MAPETAYLVPYGSGGTSDQLVRVTVTPPRSSEAEARIWPFELIALSRAGGGIAARSTAGVDVGPFSAWELTPVPALRAGRLSGRYSVTVANLGNAPTELWLYATEPENKLRGRYADTMLPLSAGESRTTELTVRVPRPRPLGRAVEHRATLEALPDEPEPEEPRPPFKQRLKKYVSPGSVSVGPHGVVIRKPRARMPRPPQRQLKLEDLKRLSPASGPVGPATQTQVTFRQKPLIPTWLLLLALLIAALVALYLLTRDHRVEVPELVGLRSTFVAQQRVQARGLTLDQTLRRDVTTLVRPGTIVAQYPEAGKKVNKGTQVTLEVAVGNGMETVPNLSNKTRAKADTELRKHDLSLGDAEPVTAPLSWVVASQIPVPGLSVADGTPIQVFLKAPPKTKAQLAAEANSGTTTTTAAAASITVPAVSGEGEEKAADAVDHAGLVPQIKDLVNVATPGNVFKLSPAAGTKVAKGSTVTLSVSEGIPDIAFDNGTKITIADPKTGAVLQTASGPDPVAIEPSFSPNGQQFVYRSDTRVFLAPTDKPSSATAIYQGPYEYTNVTFAPDPTGNVLALVRQLNGVGELCLASLTGDQLDASCLPDDGWNLGRDIAWAPDGKEILVFGASPSDSSTFGIVEYTSKVAFSTNPADWTGGQIETDVTESGEGVIAAAFSPNGKKVALVNNLTSPQFEVTIVKSGALDPTNGKTLPLSACWVAWRPDGKDLAVIEGNPTCSQATGTVVQFPLAKPRDQLQVANGATDAVAYQGLSMESSP